jgi:CRP-like cAMP-binding protein
MTTRTVETRSRGASSSGTLSAQEASRIAAAAEAACANVILASLPRELREELVDHATMLELAQGDVVERQGGPKRVFFPLSGLLSGVRTREDGAHYAYLHRGREAAVNAIGVVRPEVNFAGCDLVVDVPGRALVLEVDYYRARLEESPALMRAVLSHASHVISWREQSADCPGHHAVRARTAYFLLLLRSHQSTDMLEVTHARIAEVLGVRRQSISEALGELKMRRVIALDRGRITVTDRAALWQQACDCRGNVDIVQRLQSAGRFEYTG